MTCFAKIRYKYRQRTYGNEEIPISWKYTENPIYQSISTNVGTFIAQNEGIERLLI